MTALAPTVRTERPAPKLPAGWRCVTCSDGIESWTWSLDGVPLLSVLASPAGEVSPPMMRDPYHYWMPPEQARACAAALDALAVHLGARR